MSDVTVITQKRLKELLHYEPVTGAFTWLQPIARCLKKGAIAGCIKKYKQRNRYRMIGINYKHYPAHRLAWLYVYGQWPKDQIDHINGDGEDNRICNLREVNNLVNSKNSHRRRDNKTGHTGIYRDHIFKRWVVTISHNSKEIYLGRFVGLDEAIQVRKEAEKKYGYHPNHGRERDDK